MTNFRGVYCNGKATWLKTAPSFSSAKILGDKDVTCVEQGPKATVQENKTGFALYVTETG